MINVLWPSKITPPARSYLRFLPVRRVAQRGLCDGNVAGWLAGWLGVCHTPVLCQNG